MFLYFFLAFVATNYAQSNNSEERFIRVQKNGHYGLFNTQGEEILQPIYDIIFNENENDGGIKLRLNRKDYIFNKKTHAISKIKITNLKHEYLGNFSEDLAQIKIKGKYGYIDRSGKLVIPVLYSIAHEFSEGLAMVAFENKKYGFIDKSGKIIIPFKYDTNYSYEFSNQFICLSKGSKKGIIDTKGTELIAFNYDDISISSSGTFIVEIGKKYGLIDNIGKEILSIEYDYVGYFNDGLSKVNKDGKYGFIDKAGKLIIALKYDDATSFSGGIVKVSLDNKYGLIDKTGKEIINIKYDDIGVFKGDLCPIKLNCKWGIFNNKEEQISDFKFDKIITSYSPFFMVGIKDEDINRRVQLLWDIVTGDGKEIITRHYLGIGDLAEDLIRVEFGKGGFESHRDGCILSILQVPGKWGFINASGEEVIAPQYNYAKDFSEGFAAVGVIENDIMHWGFINKKNEVVIPMLYDRVQNFKNGLSMVELNGKWGLIDKTGKIIIPTKYDWISDFSDSLDPHRDYEMNVPTDRYEYGK